MELKVGAGKARIVLDKRIFPLEGYVGEAEPIHARALLLDFGTRVTVVSLELPSVREELLLREFRETAGRITGTAAEHVWLCTVHNLSTIHIPKEDMPEKRALARDGVEAAIVEACEAAVRTLQAARAGIGFGASEVNTNRDILTNQGWWNGLNGQGESDRLLTVCKFESETGASIALLCHYPVKSCAVSGASGSDGSRLSNSELAGGCCKKVEEQYGVPALFLMGAAADMVPARCAFYAEADENGDLREVNLGVQRGLAFKRELGAQLAEDICRTAGRTVCREPVFMAYRNTSFRYGGQKFYYLGKPYRPTPDYEYIPSGEEELAVSVLCIENTAIFGLQPETTAVIGKQLRQKTAPVVALAAAMVNGGKDYMADKLSYDRCTFSGTHSVFARGTAERFIEDADQLVREIYQDKINLFKDM